MHKILPQAQLSVRGLRGWRLQLDCQGRMHQQSAELSGVGATMQMLQDVPPQMADYLRGAQIS